MATEGRVDLWVSLDGGYMRALSIPLNRCETFSHYPLKWLRYVGYTIYGREGDVYASENSSEIVDYEADIQSGSYYFKSEEEPRLLDPDALDAGMSSGSSVSSHTKANFTRSVLDRDQACVVSNIGVDHRVLCAACHIIPRAKGNNYMSHLATYRTGKENPFHLDDVNDPRNGLFLNRLLSQMLRDGQLAFMQTPNFALDVNDIPTDVQLEEIPTSRLTMQYIAPVPLQARQCAGAAHNSDARQPENLDKWPIPPLLDAIYGSAALKTWGNDEFKAYLHDMTRNIYYNKTVVPGDSGNKATKRDSDGPDDDELDGPDEPDDDKPGPSDPKKRRTLEQTHADNQQASVRNKRRGSGEGTARH